ncbi:MAG: DUF983 domain-containing protein [Sphingobacteriales bacterium]|nr:MAG: DUF983 domain-containing protein [Sphingobacteriales bacterium]
MFKKGNKIYSMLTGTCPRCHSESMYANANPYDISETMKMHERCHHCGLVYKIEPNFFFGAMYVSYALSVLLGIMVFMISHFAFQIPLSRAFTAIMIVLALAMPLITRLSRNIYINIFVNYDPAAVHTLQASYQQRADTPSKHS